VTYIPQGSVLEAYRYFSCWKHTDIFRVGSIQIFFVLEAYRYFSCWKHTTLRYLWLVYTVTGITTLLHTLCRLRSGCVNWHRRVYKLWPQRKLSLSMFCY